MISFAASQEALLLRYLKKEGFHHVGICKKSSRTISSRVQNQKPCGGYYGEDHGYFIEAFWQEAYCSVYVNTLQNRDEIVKSLKWSAGMFPRRSAAQRFEACKDRRKQEWQEPDAEKITEVLKAAEREALQCDKVTLVGLCEYSQTVETVLLLDDAGNWMADDSGVSKITMRVIARDQESSADSTKMRVVNTLDYRELQRKACELAKDAGESAARGLHARRLCSGSYPVVMENTVLAELIGYYLPAFYADKLGYGQSVLCGKEKQWVAADTFLLKEDPFYPSGTFRRAIDDEAVEVTAKYLLKDGYIGNILHNRKTAGEQSRESTGNGFKTDVTKDVAVQATNVILCASQKPASLCRMLESAEGGIYLTSLEGVFAGIHVESGDFSLLASANRIEAGKIAGAVNQFTISGNICDLWKEIELVGGDFGTFLSEEGTCVAAPTVKVRQLVVSG